MKNREESGCLMQEKFIAITGPGDKEIEIFAGLSNPVCPCIHTRRKE